MRGIFSFTKSLQNCIWSFDENLSVYGEGDPKLGRCDLSGSEILQKIYICYPEIYEKNVRCIVKGKNSR